MNAAGEGSEVLAMANLLHLSRRARAATDALELSYVAMNETHVLVNYRQAVLVVGEQVTALSGVVSPEANAPYVQWLGRLLWEIRVTQFTEPATDLASSANPVAPALINADSMPETVREEWDEWLPLHALWLPLPVVGDDFPGGGWLLARDEPWLDGEILVVQEWAEVWVQAWALRHKPDAAERLQALKQKARAMLPRGDDWHALRDLLRRPGDWRTVIRAAWGNPRLRWSLLILVALLFPVRLTVLAPGELVAANPAVIRAPLDGVIERVAVQPNQAVKAGDLLFEFDRTTLASRLIVAVQALATAEAEYRQFAQQALFDTRSKGQLGIAQGRVEEKKAEAIYLRELNQRAGVTAPRAGVVLFDDPTELIGKPVATGERVMMVSDEHDVEVEAWISLFDAIDFAPDASVTLYLNVKPLTPVSARLRYLAHEAQQRPDGHFAYRLRAAIPAGETLHRVGLKGTTKITGGWVPAAYWVLRKPLAALRNYVGL
jgi:hypothetical protein